MNRLDLLRRRLHALDQAALHRDRKVVQAACSVEPIVDGQRMMAFCSNDYLGLANDPRIAQALCEGVARYGSGSGASHLISGHYAVHVQLEARLAAFVASYIPQAQALYFSTGYMANIGVMAGLAALDENTEIFSEELNHASLIDGMRLARVRVNVYRHCDILALEHLLKASSASTKVVVTDSVFSMDGDLAPLPELLALCEQHDAWLVVDDAHGFGVLGRQGHGALEHFGLRSDHLIYVGTLGKAAGVAGAFVAAHPWVTDWLVQRARAYIYTTASPPALACALLSSLDIIEGADGVQRRAHLQELIAELAGGLNLHHWLRPDSFTPIQPIVIGGNEAALQASRLLQQAGYWVPAIRPPTVPAGTARLRLTLSASHTVAMVRRLAKTLNEIEDLLEPQT